MKSNKIIITFIIFLIIVFTGDNRASAALKKCSGKTQTVKCVYNSVLAGKVVVNITKNGDKEDIKVNLPASSSSSKIQLSDFIKNNSDYYCPKKIYYACLDQGGASTTGCTRSSYFKNERPYKYDSFGNQTSYKVGEHGDRSLSLDTNSSCKGAKSSTNVKTKNKNINKCYYGNIILNINKKKKAITLSGNHSDIKGIDFSYSSLSNGSCPNYVCAELVFPYNPYDDKKYTLKKYDEKPNTSNVYGNQVPNKKCYAGINNDSKWKCLVIANHMTQIQNSKVYSNVYNESKSSMVNYCKMVLANNNYDDGSVGSTCLQECLKVNNEIAKLENKISNDENGCNLTEKIIAFINNILKWLKYIAPVLVIILGILDFIRALAASDDDAMKKAQKRFITRLIAAVLLFLLPLIIDYVLRIFGLYRENCDITEIFK